MMWCIRDSIFENLLRQIYFATHSHWPPDTETGKGLSQIGVDKASNAQVPLNSVTGILICVNFLCDTLKEFLSLELRKSSRQGVYRPGSTIFLPPQIQCVVNFRQRSMLVMTLQIQRRLLSNFASRVRLHFYRTHLYWQCLFTWMRYWKYSWQHNTYSNFCCAQ